MRQEEHIDIKFLENGGLQDVVLRKLDATVAAIKKKESDARELQDSAKEDFGIRE